MSSQAFVHNQLVKYLKSAKPGARMAIFALTGGRLVMLQGLTADPTLLRLAVAHAHPEASPILSGNFGAGQAAGVEAQLAAVSPEMADAIQEFQQDESDTNQAVAARQTLQALNQLARYLSGIPGRKNLIWFAGSFPLSIRPAGKSDSVPRYMAGSLSGITPWAAEYRETIGLLTRARVAIYPADANGLQTYVRISAAQWASREAMLDIAEDTGGHAFFNTNGLAQAVDQVTTEGASYYTLTYTPSNPNAHGEYRTVRVQLDVKGNKLAYRHGYYADLPAATNTDPDRQLPAIRLAIRYTAPPSTQIRFYAQLAAVPQTAEPTLTKTAAHRQLAPERFHHYLVDFSVDPLALAVTESTDGLHYAHLEFLTFVYDPQGRIVNSNAESAQATWTPAQYTTALKQGARYQQQIDVPATGPHTIRILIHDLSNDKIGSIDLPAASLQP